MTLILTLTPQHDYELLDSGEGEKLERFGNIVMARPDPQALWLKAHPSAWKQAQTRYVRTGPKSGEWRNTRRLPPSWIMNVGGLKLNIRLSAFKHTGVFPEQEPNWQWLEQVIRGSARELNVLNLFGYTGGATLVCARAGAQVTHVDSSKTAITWANQNAASSGLDEKPIRWMLEDAYEFVKKEVRRGKTYDGIIMDPPSFGHGTRGEVWKIEKQFTDLIDNCNKLLSKHPLFYLVNGYAAGYSSITYANNIMPLLQRFGGNLEHGELTLEEKYGKRLLPAGIFARWRA